MSEGFFDPAIARARYHHERSVRHRAQADLGPFHDSRIARGRGLRLIVAATGLSLLFWAAVVAAIVRAGIGLHVVAGLFFAVVGAGAIGSIFADVRRALRRMRERQA